MKVFSQPFKILLICFLTLFSAQLKAQLFGPGYSACVLRAPEKRLEGVKKVAIINFDNRSSYYNRLNSIDFGSRIADFMTTQLIKEDRGIKEDKLFIKGMKTDIFEVVERSRLNDVLREQDLQASGAVDENQAVEIGRLLGIDAIVLGSLSYTYKDERDKDTKKSEKDGKVTYSYTYTLTRTLTAEASMKIISVQTAEVLGIYTPKVTKKDTEKSKKAPPKVSSLETVDNLADAAFRQMAGQMVNYFTPHFRQTTMSLDKIKVKNFKKRAKDAHNYLKKGDLDNGYKIYKAMYDEDSYNPRLAYNLGTIYEVTGDFEKAQEYYGIASQLDGKEKKYSSALKRAEDGVQMVADLSSMGISIEKYVFGEGSMNSGKIVIKGSTSSRVAAHAAPEKGSDTVAKVPGGLSFDIVEKSGSWYKVKLLGGKEGYFHKDDVREE